MSKTGTTDLIAEQVLLTDSGGTDRKGRMK